MDEITQNRQHLKQAICSPGGKILRAYIEEQSAAGFKKFIGLPVAQKTGKAAFAAQAQYTELKELLDWIDTEVREV